ncbi:SUZ domain-containing protein 1 [Aplysia californica]|uniref:SUZ RNA-binding domain-containing n=1 Tax=Aplysia californica TaxID=6500 RepID=A0ABM0JN48_APLCA|nr:SUZ domain-containing protein 1 [Aplysia californica]
MADDDCDNLDSWENQADSGALDKRLEEISIGLQSKENKQKQGPIVMSTEDNGRSQYQPQVRILRREAPSPATPSPNHSNSTGSMAPPGSSKHSKSLQQREVEYAEARLRIFGSLPPPDSDGETEEKGGSGDNHIAQPGPPQIVGPPTSGPQMSILRQPRGPDGTNGFGKQDLT